jgi:ABC-2 type transport system ATP-binding protein
MRRAPAAGIVAGVIEVEALTKRYRSTVAVDRLSFTVAPGLVTGFLGPNGAGKTTTLRILLGLAAPTSGRALIGGRPYASIRRPLHEVGALLDANAAHPGRSALDHLRALARTHGMSAARVMSTVEEVGLTDVARRRVRGFSLGQRQRLGLAAAMLGDPGVLVLDER